MRLSGKDLAKLIDHSILQPNASDQDLAVAAEIARRWEVAALFVKPYHTQMATALMRDSGIPVGTIISFPHGDNSPQVKAHEAQVALDDGAAELDMVINVGAIKSGDWSLVERDIAGVVQVARQKGAIVKVILETGYLTDEEKVKACQVVEAAGANFVKTATGYGPSGASPENVRLMRQTVGPHFGVKASGGIRSLDAALQMVAAGATRIGTSSTAAIMDECLKRETSNCT